MEMLVQIVFRENVLRANEKLCAHKHFSNNKSAYSCSYHQSANTHTHTYTNALTCAGMQGKAPWELHPEDAKGTKFLAFALRNVRHWARLLSEECCSKNGEYHVSIFYYTYRFILRISLVTGEQSDFGGMRLGNLEFRKPESWSASRVTRIWLISRDWSAGKVGIENFNPLS